MAERSVVVRLRAEIESFKRNMEQAAKSTDAVGSKLEKQGQHISTLTNQAGVLGLAMVAAAGAAVKSFADFDQAMSNVSATGEDARGSIEALRDAAMDAGALTVFSATEAAGAVENLAKAGVSAADILSGGLQGSLDLAAAGQLDVAQAAEIASVALTQFSLAGEDVTHVADLLAAGAGKAMGDVSDLGEALKQGGLVASQVGLSIEETVAGLAAFAEAGLLGSDAGTSLKTMLQRLTPQSEEAQRQFDALGISAYDAQGQFVGLEAFAGQLQESMAHLTPEARNAALSVMFGSDAVRAASVLYSQGAKGIAEWTDKVDDSGYAAEVAAERMDNLKGDIEQLRGSLETALIGLGEGADGPLRALVQSATDVVNAFAELPPAAQNATLALVGGGGLVLLGGAGLAKLVTTVNDAKVAMQALGVSAKTASVAVAGVGAVLAAGAIGLTIWAENAAEARARTAELKNTLDELGGVTENTLDSINASFAEQRGGWLEDLFGGRGRSVIDMAEEFGVALEDLQGYVLGEEEALRAVTAAVDEYEQAHLSELGSTEMASRVNAFVGALDDEAGALTNAEKEMAQKARADEAAGIASADLAREYETTTGAIDGQSDALKELIALQEEAAGVVLTEREAQRQFADSLDGARESVEQQIDDLARLYEAEAIAAGGSEMTAEQREEAARAARARAEAEVAVADKLDITTEAGRRNQAALDDIAQSGFDLLEAMEAAGSSQGDLQTIMASTRDEFINAATAMGMSEDAAKELADELGLIPQQINTTINVSDEEARLRADRFIDAYANSVIPMSLLLTPDVGALSQEQLDRYGAARRAAQGGNYWTGGYTGTGGVYEPAGIVHKGEFVANQATTRRYRAELEAMHAGTFPGYASGGFVGGLPAADSTRVVQVATTNERYSPINIGTVVAADVNDFQRQADRRRARDNWTGGRRG